MFSGDVSPNSIRGTSLKKKKKKKKKKRAITRKNTPEVRSSFDRLKARQGMKLLNRWNLNA